MIRAHEPSEVIRLGIEPPPERLEVIVSDEPGFHGTYVLAPVRGGQRKAAREYASERTPTSVSEGRTEPTPR
jgi:hypothetical protein